MFVFTIAPKKNVINNLHAPSKTKEIQVIKDH